MDQPVALRDQLAPLPFGPAFIRADSVKNDERPKLRVAKRIVVAVIGGTVTLIGIALIVLPGPAFVVIPIGLSILATQFLWAKRFLRKARQMATRLTSNPPHDA